jgi:hypothetical protein
MPRSVRSDETARDGRDVRRTAHNPELEGSNPSPATKARGPFSNRERAFCISRANGFAHGSRRSSLWHCLNLARGAYVFAEELAEAMRRRRAQ